MLYRYPSRCDEFSARVDDRSDVEVVPVIGTLSHSLQRPVGTICPSASDSEELHGHGVELRVSGICTPDDARRDKYDMMSLSLIHERKTAPSADTRHVNLRGILDGNQISLGGSLRGDHRPIVACLRFLPIRQLLYLSASAGRDWSVFVRV
jgi:hypothetical protein